MVCNGPLTTDNEQFGFNLIVQFKMNANFTSKPTSNIDETEIARFEAMAPIWWDKHGDLKALHDINALRLNYINDRIPLAGKTVLDAGCGGGILLLKLWPRWVRRLPALIWGRPPWGLPGCICAKPALI